MSDKNWCPDLENPENTVPPLPQTPPNAEGPFCPPFPPTRPSTAVQQFDWYVCEVRRLMRALDEASAQWQVALASRDPESMLKAKVAYQWAANSLVTFMDSRPFGFKVEQFSIDAKEPTVELGLARSFYVRVVRPDGFTAEIGATARQSNEESASSSVYGSSIYGGSTYGSSTYGDDASGTTLNTEQAGSSIYGSSIYG